jgi:pimeloyl-ACP methyl ester carboxylesterase
MEQFRSGELVFDVSDAGPEDGPVVILLHGFPQMNTCWNGVIPRLVAQGYRCLAPNQRGYSAGARPARRRDYRLPELVEDVRALIDACGAARVHLVGHDWGAGVTWAAAAEIPERLATVTALSVPHSAAFLKAIATSRQFFASWYMLLFQLPRFPEWYLTSARLAKSLRATRQTPEAAERDALAMAEPGRLTAAINWYRGIPLSDMRGLTQKVTVPALYVWSDGDTAVLGKCAHDCARYVSGEYRFEILRGASHWIPEERADAVADLLLEWFGAHPVG